MLWTHFCFRGLWEDEMFARQVRHVRNRRGKAVQQYCYSTVEAIGLSSTQA